MAECGAVCEHLHLPAPGGQRPHAGPHAPRLHRRALPPKARRRPRRDPRPRRDHRPHRRLPRRDRRRLPPHARGRRRRRVRRRVHVRVLAPAGNARGRDVRRASCRPRSRRNACDSWSRSWSDTRFAKHEARVGRVEEVLVEGPSKKDPSVLVGPDPPEQAGALRGAGRSERARRARRRAHRRRRAALAARRPGARPRVAAAGPDPHPRRSGVATATHLALVGPTASGKSALALGAAHVLGDVEIVSVDSMQVYRGLDIGTAKPTVAERARGAAPPHRRGRARARSGRRRVTRPRRVRRSPTSRRAASARCSSAGRACTCRRSSTTCASRARTSTCGPSSRPTTAEPGGVAAAYAELRRRRPRRGRARIDPHNARRIVRALEVIRLTGQPFSSFGPGLDQFGPTAFPVRDGRCLAARATCSTPASRQRFARDARRRPRRRGAAAARRPVALADRAPGDRLQGDARRDLDRRASLDAAFDDGRRAAPGRSPGASGCGSGATPGSRGWAPPTIRAPCCPRCWQGGAR